MISISIVNTSLRVLQLMFSLIAMSCSTSGTYSHSFNFILIATYSAFIYPMLWLGWVHALKKREPQRIFILSIDAILSIFLFSGGIAIAVSDQIKHCNLYNSNIFGKNILDCDTLRTSVVFSFLAMCTFIATFVIKALEFKATQYDVHTPTHSPSGVFVQ